MPVKTVHFSDANQVYSQPTTPSPSNSAPELPTSITATPPRSNPQLQSRYSFTPLPIELHEVLKLSLKVKFNFDLADILQGPIHSQLPLLASHTLSEAATILPTASFTIVCKHLPWSITIEPGSPKPDAFVTVSDVLDGLRRALRTQVRDTELASETPECRAVIHEAFSRRCIHAGAGAAAEREEGVKRIDFLIGHHRFLGFTAEGPLVWRLSVSR